MSKDGLSKGVPDHIMKAMKSHPSFHGTLTREDVTKLLYTRKGSCYLTRYSGHHKTCVISTKTVLDDGDLLQHFKLNITISSENGGFLYEVEGTNDRFDDIGKSLDHYQSNPVAPHITSFGECVEFKQHHLMKLHQKSTFDLVSVISTTVTLHSLCYYLQTAVPEASEKVKTREGN